jgi:hypothetical protein
MSLREAAQQALEALEYAQSLDIPHFEEHVNALAALRAALAEPEQEFVCSTGLCRYRKPLTDEEILLDEVLRYHFGCNGGAGPVSQKGIKIVRAVERAHGIGGEA